jgi:release factor glutamine methyltransferase
MNFTNLTKHLPRVANLPYLSKKIYSSAPNDVKKYEPKSALYSCEAGLAHYHKLLKQIKEISINYKLKTISCILEISPEQKQSFTKLIKNILPEAKISFEKDLARKWRICKIDIYS